MNCHKLVSDIRWKQMKRRSYSRIHGRHSLNRAAQPLLNLSSRSSDLVHRIQAQNACEGVILVGEVEWREMQKVLALWRVELVAVEKIGRMLLDDLDEAQRLEAHKDRQSLEYMVLVTHPIHAERGMIRVHGHSHCRRTPFRFYR